MHKYAGGSQGGSNSQSGDYQQYMKKYTGGSQGGNYKQYYDKYMHEYAGASQSGSQSLSAKASSPIELLEKRQGASSGYQQYLNKYAGGSQQSGSQGGSQSQS